jgi:hypothetical protein
MVSRRARFLTYGGVAAILGLAWLATGRETPPFAPSEERRQLVPSEGGQTSVDAPSPAVERIGDPSRIEAGPLPVVNDRPRDESQLRSATAAVVQATRVVAAMQLQHFAEQRAKAEADAGSSPAAYLWFLEMQIEWLMRSDAVAALDVGRCFEVPQSVSSPVAPNLFDGAPYMCFSTGPGSTGVQTMVAVPMTQVDSIKALRSSIVETRQFVVRSYIDEFNRKPAERRRSIRAAYASTGDLDGLPRFVTDLIGYRLRWSEPELFLSLANG